MATGRRNSFGIYLLLASCFLLQNAEEINGEAMRLELIHRHHPRVNRRPLTQFQRVKENVYGDTLRLEMISHKRRLGQVSASLSKGNSSAKMALIPGRDFMIAQYFVPFKVGTPAQEFLLIADTGSELTWMRCTNKLGPDNGSSSKLDKDGARVFNAGASSSFGEIPCSSDMCKVWLREHMNASDFCPTPSTPCSFSYGYVNGAFTEGSLATETVTVPLADGGKVETPEFVIGCSKKSHLFNGSDGVLGLGYNPESFTIKATKTVAHKFSYCLVDQLSHKDVFSYLTFGETRNKSRLLWVMKYIKLYPDLLRPFYAVKISGISVGGRMLRIPATAWRASNGSFTILDSGASLTYLVKPAYHLVMEALKPSISRFQRLNEPELPMEYCFNSTGYLESMVPRLVIHFEDGIRFRPHVKSYIIDVDSEEKCLGFLSLDTDNGINILGNIMQQNHFWEFDLEGNRVGFAPSMCR